MKPCTKKKPLLVWLALGELNAEDACQLKLHLDLCPACQEYFKEVALLCRQHQDGAEMLPPAQVSESFHGALRARIEAAQARPAILKGLEAFLRQLAGLTLPQTAAASLGLVVASVWLWISLQTPKPQRQAQAQASIQHAATALPPTLATYRMIANTSLDAFDDLLVRQADGGSPTGHSQILSPLSRWDLEN